MIVFAFLAGIWVGFVLCLAIDWLVEVIVKIAKTASDDAEHNSDDHS